MSHSIISNIIFACCAARLYYMDSAMINQSDVLHSLEQYWLFFHISHGRWPLWSGIYNMSYYFSMTFSQLHVSHLHYQTSSSAHLHRHVAQYSPWYIFDTYTIISFILLCALSPSSLINVRVPIQVANISEWHCLESFFINVRVSVWVANIFEWRCMESMWYICYSRCYNSLTSEYLFGLSSSSSKTVAGCFSCQSCTFLVNKYRVLIQIANAVSWISCTYWGFVVYLQLLLYTTSKQ